MAAPAHFVRLSPTGFRQEDGHPTFITFSENLALNIFERDVQPPGIDGGDEINTTTQHNEDFRTFAPRSLKTLTPHQVVAAYDVIAYSELFVMVNQRQTITITFPNGSQLSFFGYLKTVDPAALVDGEMPLMTLTIVPTNYDPVNCVEAAPVLTAVGTC